MQTVSKMEQSGAVLGLSVPHAGRQAMQTHLQEVIDGSDGVEEDEEEEGIQAARRQHEGP